MDGGSDIYKNIEDDGPLGCEYANVVINRNPGTLNIQQHSGNTAKSRCPRLFTVCSALLCVLLLSGIILLTMKLNKVTTEGAQMQIRYDNMTAERDQLQTERDRLQTERDRLQTARDQLQTERDGFQKMLDYYIQNCWRYFITTKKETWNNSRNDCKSKGADLVIINSREEQELISKLFKGIEAWIGLTDAAVEGTWIWVDGTALNTRFWWDGEPNDFKKEDCVVTSSKFAKVEVTTWADYPCHLPVLAICEKK